jgi:hypothetical protein
MKSIRSSSVSKLVMLVVGVLVVFSLAVSVPSGVAFADTPTPTPHTHTHDTSGLTKAFQNEQALLGTQQGNLDKAGGATSKIQDLIDKANAKGLDTSALSSALSTFQAQLNTAQSSHDTAGSILSAHNGFDGSGNVTDAAAAAQTVKDARQALTDAHNSLSQASHDLQAAVKAWEADNKGKILGEDLTKAYQREQDWLTKQQANLGKANDAVTRVQDLISKAQAKGIDTSALDAALGTFQSQLATAQASDNTAANVLSAHNGFDASGAVTDNTAAAQTVKDADQALKDASGILTQATKDLQTAVKNWEEANKDKLQDGSLQKVYQNEQNWFGIQTTNLGKANDAVAKIQDLISQAQAKGLDTSALSAALSTYQAQLATAQSSHDTANTVLSAHNGFDAGGNVTDQTAAAQTVKDANQALKDAHDTLVQAVTDMQAAVKLWKSQNQPTATPDSSTSGL